MSKASIYCVVEIPTKVSVLSVEFACLVIPRCTSRGRLQFQLGRVCLRVY